MTKKRKKGKLCLCLNYGRFLTVNNDSTANPSIMTTIMAIIAGRKYVSAIDATGVAVGAVVVSQARCCDEL